MLERYEEAKNCILKCKEIAQHYDLKLIKAKAGILLSSILIKQKAPFSEVVLYLEQSEKIFFEMSWKDGVADSMFLKAIALINSINNKV